MCDKECTDFKQQEDDTGYDGIDGNDLVHEGDGNFRQEVNYYSPQICLNVMNDELQFSFCVSAVNGMAKNKHVRFSQRQ